MSLIRQRDTKLEQRFRLALWHRGVRYRKNVRIYGTPDIVIRKSKLLVFVDSCFWHGCPRHCRRPKTNVAFWSRKIDQNRERDLSVTRYYRRTGWAVLRFWEHRLIADFEGCVAQVLEKLDC